MKSKYKTTILLFLLLSIRQFGQTYSSITTDKEIYDFLNWMTKHEDKYREESKLKRKAVFYKILTWDSANFIAKDSNLINQFPYFEIEGQYLFQKRAGADTLFSKADRRFLFQQFNAIKDTVWHMRFSHSKLLKNGQQNRPRINYYSIPLFTENKKYVIIHRYYYCGNLCAHGGYFIYEKIGDNKWKYITAVNTWMS
jgi:hypothetical protein